MMHFLYALTVTLQLADARSTLAPGGREVNPIMRSLVEHPAALYAVKGSAGAGIAWTGAKLHASHPKATLWYLIAVNVAQSAVIIHNARTR